MAKEQILVTGAKNADLKGEKGLVSWYPS